MTKPKTVKVRIAVAVDPDGKWNAVGWSDYKTGEPVQREAMDLAVDVAEPGEARYIITAELPVPGVKEVEGMVDET